MTFRYRIRLSGDDVAPAGSAKETEIETKCELPSTPSPENKRAILDIIRRDVLAREGLDFEGWPEFVGERPDGE